MRAFPEHLEQYRNLTVTQCDGLEFAISRMCPCAKNRVAYLCLYIFGQTKIKKLCVDILFHIMCLYIIMYIKNCSISYINIYLYYIYVLYTIDVYIYRVSRVWLGPNIQPWEKVHINGVICQGLRIFSQEVSKRG